MMVLCVNICVLLFKQKTAYEMRISDWSSDVCSSDLHVQLKDIERAEYVTCNDNEALDAFFKLSRLEGIIPALESCHAVSYAMKLAKKMREDQNRSEERRVGKECVSTCRSRWTPYH